MATPTTGRQSGSVNSVRVTIRPLPLVHECRHVPARDDREAELQPYFEEARASRTKQAGDETNEEFDSPVDKRFRGLRVTAVIVGYEWQGVAFGDPADKVRDTFRQMGFKIDKQGDFAVEDDVVVSASMRPTDPGSKNRGKSELTCGV